MGNPGIEHESQREAGAVLEAAAGFGLTPEEMVSAVSVAVDRLPADMRAECIDELAGEFGRRLIAKQRGSARIEP